MNLERILGKLKNERRRIEKAISALEKALSAKSSTKGHKTAKSKKHTSRVKNVRAGRPDTVEKREHNRGKEANVIALTPAARRVS